MKTNGAGNDGTSQALACLLLPVGKLKPHNIPAMNKRATPNFRPNERFSLKITGSGRMNTMRSTIRPVTPATRLVIGPAITHLELNSGLQVPFGLHMAPPYEMPPTIARADSTSVEYDMVRSHVLTPKIRMRIKRTGAFVNHVVIPTRISIASPIYSIISVLKMAIWSHDWSLLTR